MANSLSRRRIAVIAGLGFSSGLPLPLTGQTLGAWLTDSGLRLETIGALSMVALVYNMKWAWAPLFDRFALPWLGRRRGWMAALQLALGAAIFLLAGADPAAPGALAAVAVVVAILSASQDIVVDAYQTELLAPDERAAGAAAYVSGYRVGMVVGIMVPLGLADVVAWSTLYEAMAALMVVGLAATLLAPEPPRATPPARLRDALTRPVLGLLRAPGAAHALAFVALYKLGDYALQPLVVPFLRRGAHFHFAEVAAYGQVLGLVGTLLGGAAAAVLVPRRGIRGALVLFGLLQAATNLLYAALAFTGRSPPVLVVAFLCDHAANAMGSAAFVAYLMSRIDRAVSATQYALLTSVSSLAGRLLVPAGAALAAHRGWPTFFLATFLVSFPGLLLAARVPLAGPAGADSGAAGPRSQIE